MNRHPSTVFKSNRLAVPGAHLYYKTVGSGPVLAMIGLPATSESFEQLASYFSSDYTVVTFDPRGFGQSLIDDKEEDATQEQAADDFHRILAALTKEPAVVFGSSGGAVTGLVLAEKYPSQLRTLVAHEPSVFEVLPDAGQIRAKAHQINRIYRTKGIGPATIEFMDLLGLPKPELDNPPALSEQQRADADRFYKHGILTINSYRPDISAMKNAATRIVIGVGKTSGGQMAHRAANALAEMLGKPAVEFPGGHGGFIEEPLPFAQLLRQVIEQ